MKKVLAILLIAVYSCAAIGGTVHLHYCMDKLAGWSLFENKQDKCSKCGMKDDAKKKGCCKDEQKEFKLKTEHQKSTIADAISYSATPILLTPISNINFKLPLNASYNYRNYHPPPKIYQQNLQVLYCTFLI